MPRANSYTNATRPASDDEIILDGATNGTRNISAEFYCRNIDIAGTTPASPQTKDLWFDTSVGILKIYNSGQFSSVVNVTASTITDSTAAGRTLLTAADAAAQRTALSLVVGTNVQAHSGNLTSFATVAPSANGLSFVSAADYAAMRTLLSLNDYASVTPSANGLSLISAANYAAMRTLLSIDAINSTTIGATTPSTGAFTTLTTTGDFTVGAGADLFNGSVRISDNASSPAATYLQSGEPGISLNNVVLANNYYGVNGAGSGRRNSSLGAAYLRLHANTGTSSSATIGVVSAAGVQVDAVTITNTGINSTAIGATTPSTGAFTTLSTNSNVTFTLGTNLSVKIYAGASGAFAQWTAEGTTDYTTLNHRNNADNALVGSVQRATNFQFINGSNEVFQISGHVLYARVLQSAGSNNLVLGANYGSQITITPSSDITLAGVTYHTGSSTLGAFGSGYPMCIWNTNNTAYNASELRFLDSGSYNQGGISVRNIVHGASGTSDLNLYVRSSGTLVLAGTFTSTGLGIGNSSPTDLLHLEKNATGFSGINIYNPHATSNPGIFIRNATSGSSSGGGMGLYYSGNDFRIRNDFSNNIIFGTGGADKVWIDTNGRFGVGAAPSSYLITASGTAADIAAVDSAVVTRIIATNSGGVGIVETATNHPLVFRTNQGERARMDATGFAIGTSSITHALTVTGTGQIAQLNHTGASLSMVITNTDTSANNTSGGIGLGNNDGSALASGDRMGVLVFFGNNGGGATSTSNTALIGVYATEAWSNASAYGTKIGFDTTPNGSTTRTNIVEIDGAGLTIASGKALKLGVAYTSGTVTPDGYLTVKDSNGTSYRFAVEIGS